MPLEMGHHIFGAALDYIVIVVTAVVLDSQIKGGGLSFCLFLALPRENSSLDGVCVCMYIQEIFKRSNRNLSSFIRKHLSAKLKFNFLFENSAVLL